MDKSVRVKRPERALPRGVAGTAAVHEVAMLAAVVVSVGRTGIDPGRVRRLLDDGREPARLDGRERKVAMRRHRTLAAVVPGQTEAAFWEWERRGMTWLLLPRVVVEPKGRGRVE